MLPLPGKLLIYPPTGRKRVGVRDRMEQNLFGQILLNFNLITEEQLERCVNIQRGTHPPKMLGEIMLDQGFINEKTLNNILSIQRRKMDLTKVQPQVKKTELELRLKNARAADLLRTAKELGASDLYVNSHLKPAIRLHGNLIELPAEAFPLDETKKLLFELLEKEQIDRYYTKKYLDLCLEVPGIGRFRTNIFRHFKGIGAVFRVIADDVWPFDKLGLPIQVKQFIDYSRGLVLVTGPAGSGKSTTMASLLDIINHNHRLHIITIEDPIEVVFKSDKSFVTQRQVYTHTQSFAAALRAALREDPDVIVVGEMRDPETVATAITAAETGHLVFGTLHTHNAYRTILRILDQFPAQKRSQIRTMLAGVLRGVVSQQLIPNTDGKGRSLACEVMVVNSAISNLIREDRPWQIPMIMQMGRNLGMRLMDDSLLDLVKAKKISVEEALSRAIERDKFLNPR